MFTSAQRRFVLVLVLLGSSVAVASTDPSSVPTAPVTVDGVELFRVRGVSAYPAERRAAVLASRIEQCADGDVAMPGVTLEPTELATRLWCGQLELMLVYNADAETEGVRLPVLAETLRKRIDAAVVSWREDRDRDRLLRSAGFAGVAVLVLVLSLLVLRFLFRRVDTRLDAVLKERASALAIQSFQVLRTETAYRVLKWVMSTLHLALAVAAVLATGQLVLARFPWTRGAAAGLTQVVLGPLTALGSKALSAVPGLVFIAIVVYLARALLRVVRLFFTAVEAGSVKFTGFEPEWAMPTFRLVRWVLLGLTVVVIYPYIPGSDSDAFKGLSLMLGVLLSLGGSSYISNLIAGYTMTFRRAFRVGDRIQVGEVSGVVTEMRLQVTHVRTEKNEELIVPNSVILSSAVRNFSSISRAGGLLLHTRVGIGYETPWRQVEAMLLMAARRAVGDEWGGKAFVNIKELGDFAITYELNVPHRDPTQPGRQYSTLHRHVLDVFNEYGVQIMTPNYEADPPDAKLVPKDQWFAAPAPVPSEPVEEPKPS